jgi:predicted CopG family antitoxin
MDMPKADKRIPLREDTYKELGHLKEAGQTWNELVEELIEDRRRQNRRELLERTDDSEYVPLEDV